MTGLRSGYAAGVLVLLIAACSSSPPTTAPSSSSPPTAAPSSAPLVHRQQPSPSAGDRCDDLGVAERLEIVVGGSSTSATGLGVRYEGMSHDSYDDGSTDLLLSLGFWTEDGQTDSWMPSAFAKPRYERFLAHCVRVTEASESRVIIEVAPDVSTTAP